MQIGIRSSVHTSDCGGVEDRSSSSRRHAVAEAKMTDVTERDS